jgi:serine/threonine-protein kinase HipA
MAKAKAKKFSTQKHTFLTKRFDRSDNGERIHFASAMTMLGRTDGDDYNDGISYLNLVEFLIKNGCNVQEDLEQLWRRIVFSICVSNTDDHLRNHGFILTPKGWGLSPAYDINPVATGAGLKLNISEDDNELNLDLAISVCLYFRVNQNRALEIVDEVKSAVRSWRDVAKKYNISKTEQELKARAFSKAE